MSLFNIHFFKEKSRKIDLEQLIAFFESIEGFHIEMDEKSVRLYYTHQDCNMNRFLSLRQNHKSLIFTVYHLNSWI